MNKPNVQRGNKGYLANRSRVPVKNASGSNTIPAFGLVVPTGSESTTGAITVDRPSSDGVDVYVNGPSPIPPNGYGIASKAWPLYAAYDTGATPAAGQTWGAAANSYLLTTGKTGFVIQGTPANSRVLIAPTAASSGGGGISSVVGTSPVRAVDSGGTATVSLNAGSFSNEYLATLPSGTNPQWGGGATAIFGNTTLGVNSHLTVNVQTGTGGTFTLPSVSGAKNGCMIWMVFPAGGNITASGTDDLIGLGASGSPKSIAMAAGTWAGVVAISDGSGDRWYVFTS